jgi:hypothetical protein
MYADGLAEASICAVFAASILPGNLIVGDQHALNVNDALHVMEQIESSSDVEIHGG